jgi:pyruvate,water dikinase
MPDMTVLGTFFGDESFPIEWKDEQEKSLHWFYDDLHCPQPISPMYFDIGGWWLTCRYMYRRFGLPFGQDWIAKKINNYVYSAIVPQDDEEIARLGPYFGMVLPVYATKFYEWWKERLVPEVLRNFEFLDSYPYDTASLAELMVLFEDALDIQERHFRIHWLINMAQFASFLNFQNIFAEVVEGGADPILTGKILVSIDDRNWDSVRGLCALRDQVKADATLRQAFQGETASEILSALNKTDKGREFLGKVKEWAKEFGFKAMYTHEYIFPLWVENNAPIIEAIKGYLESGYDVEVDLQKVKDSQNAAIAEMFTKVKEADKPRLQEALDMALKMAPMTPDHHFYFDQGTYARMRLVLLAIGRKLVENGVLNDAEDIMYLTYDELRHIAAVPTAFDAKALTQKRRDENLAASNIRPRDWVGTVTKWSLYDEPYKSLWGFPEKFTKTAERSAEPADVITGLAASPGVVEGVARFVKSPAEFDQVQKGEIMVCKMTNPAWVVVFTKIKGLVTDAGGVLAHPAVVSREFGIPAVVGTSVATEKIKTGMRIRVNGNTGVVEIIG